jgi:hypothetical protein
VLSFAFYNQAKEKGILLKYQITPGGRRGILF